jgi:hypothetical protein
MDSKLKRLHDTIAIAIRDMTPDDLTHHPEGKWSTTEVLEHLNLTYTGTIKNLERCLAAGKAGASSDRRSKLWQRLIVTRLGYLPTGRKSPDRVRPHGMPCEQVVAEILRNINRMDSVIRECETRFGKRDAVADHPVLGPFTVSEWRSFHLVHGKHHVKQIVRLREHGG